MNKKRMMDWQYSVRKTGAILQLWSTWYASNGDFWVWIFTRITLTQRTKGKRYGVKIHARPCVRVCVCPRVRARVGMCVCACAWVRGLLSRFFSRGCVRVGACAYACARVGGVGCKAAGTLARGQARWICTIHHEHKGISCFPRTQRDRLFTFTTNPRVSLPTNSMAISLPTNPRVILSPRA